MSSLAWPLVKIGALESIAFRLRPIMALSAYPVTIFANYCLYMAVFSHRETVAGYTVGEAVTYIGIAWLMRSTFKTNTDRHIGYRVRSGDIALDLMRPIYYPALVFWQNLGRTLSRLLIISVPLIVFSKLAMNITTPRDLKTWAFFAASVAIAHLMVFSIDFMVGVSAFFVEFNVEFAWTIDLTVRLMAGLVIPIDFFPKAFASVLLHSPLKYIYFLPIQIYLGRIPAEEIAPALFSGFLWLMGMLLAAHILFKAGTRRLTIQGG
ncbi:MAG: ABC-2 family transporter protein [Candidatus Coatesbacteria bacterium]|nr:ABC-2 family transporter protein [Candidatus Coatesbacteria bacterium]